MRISHIVLIFLVVLISTIIGKDDSVMKANVENLKILRNSVNFAYKAGNNFLDLIRGTTPPHKSVQDALNVVDKKDNFKLSELFLIYVPYAGFICLLLVGLLFVIFVPIVGFCFCCCRCAGKCGGRIKGMDPKHATCKRYAYALFLGIISIVQLAGIVLAFINNQLIHDTLTNPSPEISAVSQISHGTETLKVSLKNISEAIYSAEKMSPSNGDSDIKGVNFEDLTCKGYMSVLNKDINNLDIDTKLLKISRNLNDTLDFIKNFRQKNAKLENYASELPKEMSKLKNIKIELQVCKMLSDITKTNFEDLKGLIRQQVKDGKSAGTKLREIVELINTTAVTSLNIFNKGFQDNVKLEYMEYRMYICIGVCCLLLLIVLFYFLGLCFGQCGERPFEDARICNRGVGANLMMAGVAFAFLFTPSIMMFEIALFMSGGTMQTDLCRYISNADQPLVRPLDLVLQTMPTTKDHKFLKANILESIFNKCATDAMTTAFNIDNDMMPENIMNKIDEISSNVRNSPMQRKMDILNFYFQSIESLLSNITIEVQNSRGNSDNSDVQTRQTYLDKLNAVSISINEFSVDTLKQKFRNSFDNAAIMGFNKTLSLETTKVLNQVYLSPYSNVKCDGIYKSARSISDAFCITFLWPFNGFWYGVGICLIFTIPAIIFAVKLAGLYRRTEKYSADYEEPDYHSYMGFYTNNADNIPMKRPKSAKSNNKTSLAYGSKL